MRLHLLNRPDVHAQGLRQLGGGLAPLRAVVGIWWGRAACFSPSLLSQMSCYMIRPVSRLGRYGFDFCRHLPGDRMLPQGSAAAWIGHSKVR